jgi:hypothetical protein
MQLLLKGWRRGCGNSGGGGGMSAKVGTHFGTQVHMRIVRLSGEFFGKEVHVSRWGPRLRRAPVTQNGIMCIYQSLAIFLSVDTA